MHQDETGEMRALTLKSIYVKLGMKQLQYVGSGGLLDGLERGWKRGKSEKVRVQKRAKCNKEKG